MKYRNFLFFFLVCSISLLTPNKAVTTFAASYKMINSANEAKFGNTVIGFSWNEIWKSNGKNKQSIIKNDNLAWGATTDGSDIFYGIFYGQVNDLNHEWGMDVYKKNIFTSEVEKIGKVKYGTKVVFYYNGVLYLETASDGGIEIPDVEQYNISSGKRKLLFSNTKIAFVKKGILVCTTEPGEFDDTGHYMYKVCVYNYKKKKGKILVKQGFGVLSYKKNKIRYVKVLKNKRIYKGQVYEYNLETGKNKAISKTFRSGSIQVKIKGKKFTYYDKNNKKKVMKLK